MPNAPSPLAGLPSRILIATGNRHKAEEIRQILQVPAVAFLTLQEAFGENVPTCEETGETFADNAAQKATFYAVRSGLPTLADDSGLVVDALGGGPGVYSARWQGESTPYPIKNRKLLELLRDVAQAERTARFVCAAVLAWPDGRTVTAQGVHEGRIAETIRGETGFGYDPVFFSLELQGTFGELGAAAKNEVSHRARAMQALLAAVNGGDVGVNG